LSALLGPVKIAQTVKECLGWQNERRCDESKLAPYAMTYTLTDADTRPKGTQSSLR
jgi:hypothetical protein